jgi:hypothetical protein
VEYHEIDSVNQSLLKKILIHPQEFLKAKERYGQSEEDHFVFGSMVDIMLTGTKEEFDKKFYKVPDDIKCSPGIKAVIDGVFESIKEDNNITALTMYRPVIEFQCNKQGFQNNWKTETKVTKILEEGSGYFDILKQGLGKVIVTESEYSKAVICMMAAKGDPYLKFYTNKKEVPKTTEFLDKFIIQFTTDNVDMKGELDRVVIDHKVKTIRPIDFKTIGQTISNFEKDFWKFRYDFQAATYYYGLVQHPDIVKLIDQGYSVLPFLYIVLESEANKKPMGFQISGETIKIGCFGGINKLGNYYEGLKQAITRYKYATENKAWDYPMEYYLNNGFIEI